MTTSKTRSRVDFEVRQHLWAQRKLAEAETIDTKAKVAKMLAEVKPGRKICGMTLSPGRSENDDKKPKPVICGKPGTRMLGLTGNWTCDTHDPLRRPETPVCCVRAEKDDGRTVIETCADHDGLWECTAGIVGHGWDHRFTKLGRGM